LVFSNGVSTGTIHSLPPFPSCLATRLMQHTGHPATIPAIWLYNMICPHSTHQASPEITQKRAKQVLCREEVSITCHAQLDQ
jgi:hypothetical protein